MTAQAKKIAIMHKKPRNHDRPLCGRLTLNTTERGKVTCKKCLRIIELKQAG